MRKSIDEVIEEAKGKIVSVISEVAAAHARELLIVILMSKLGCQRLYAIDLIERQQRSAERVGPLN